MSNCQRSLVRVELIARKTTLQPALFTLPSCLIFDRGCDLVPIVWILRSANRHKTTYLVSPLVFQLPQLATSEFVRMPFGMTTPNIANNANQHRPNTKTNCHRTGDRLRIEQRTRLHMLDSNSDRRLLDGRGIVVRQIVRKTRTGSRL
jgi:hypothetical protein